MELKLAPVGASWDEDVNRWYVEMDGDTVCHGLQEQSAKHLRDILIRFRSELAAKDARIAELEDAGKELHRCLIAMVDRWEPDTEGLDRVM